MKVYVAFEGEYENRGVVGVFGEEEEAKEASYVANRKDWFHGPLLKNTERNITDVEAHELQPARRCPTRGACP